MKHAARLWLTTSLVGLSFFIAAEPLLGADQVRLVLPEPVLNPHSTEICLNSRISFHGGWSGTASLQMLANVVQATSRAPVTGAYRVVYVATRDAVYRYDADTHTLLEYKAGDWRSDPSAAFEVGVAAETTIDAGAAMHLAQLESVALWTGTTGQLAGCPRASATTFANGHWDAPDSLDIVISFGKRSVPGFTSTLVAISSDGSLPDPRTDGVALMDSVLQHLVYEATFAEVDLTTEQISQLLWAAYGCSNHRVGSKGGLVCSSAMANYYLTRRIYSAGANGVFRFHNRRPPGDDLTTRDHRIELVTAGDARSALREAVAALPHAPQYLIFCVGETGNWPELEVGFAAMGAVLEASTMGLQGYLNTSLSAAEQSDIRTGTGIPGTDIPIAVVSMGPPGVSTDVAVAESVGERLALAIESSVTTGGDVTLNYMLPVHSAVRLTIYDCLGRPVRTLIEAAREKGPQTAVWDCRDDRGQPALSGTYFCHLTAGNRSAGARVVVVR